jgi:hypothetical protein
MPEQPKWGEAIRNDQLHRLLDIALDNEESPTQQREAIHQLIRELRLSHLEIPPIDDVELRTDFDPSGMINGVTVVKAPQEAIISLEMLTKGAFPHSVYGIRVDADRITIAEQVVYLVTGYDARQAALICQLIEDRREHG